MRMKQIFIFLIVCCFIFSCETKNEYKKALTQKIEKMSGNNPKSEIAVSLEDFFIGNEDLSSIGANLGDQQPSIQTFYSILKKIRDRQDVQDVLVRIYDAPTSESWASTDTVYIITSLPKNKVIELVQVLKPTEVYENWMYDVPRGAPELLELNKPFSIWWD